MTNIRKDKYKFSQALRPFSFAVALVACGAGLSLAWVDGSHDPVKTLLVLLGGVLLQAGVNLINDYSDLSENVALNSIQALAIKRNFRIGLICFVMATCIGVWFVYQVGAAFLVLCFAGLIGALGYTLKPLNYKSRGLGVILVFWLMGVLMVVGSYLALAGQWNSDVVLFSIPISLLVSLLLLSNELRDFEADRKAHIHTLVVRMGYAKGRLLYKLIISAVALNVILLAWWFNQFWLLSALLAFVLVPGLFTLLQVDAAKRGPLTSGSGRLLLVFGVLFNLSLLFGVVV
ncbi:prenyltransferase [Neptunomonas antarctica]|uniref:1,4-dihydroxy-2-naphthoate prenyltransferase n=1 Tax=Neptunomonas antarctica TaxID=619304 RepID=A0A1N7M0E1_9GAMM|nr:prenyltransferase [Neptunomonas antarctica]SIS79565.1 1,4-dihydroxy-2-naphthoate prenyltransferase [Neptunomonas antarctica]